MGKASPSSRNAFYDNLKFVLIVLVVIGHLSGPLREHDPMLKAFWQWIYLFHMPAFIFVSGVFSKRLYTKERGLRVNVIAFYILMGVLLFTALWAWGHLYNYYPVFDLLNMGAIPWYFYAMAAFGCLLPIVSKIRGGWKAVVPLSVALAVGAGFIDRFDDFLALGRIFTYAPFYFAGYFTSISGYADWLKNARKARWPVILALACMVGLFVFMAFGPKGIPSVMSGMATGHNPYSHYPKYPMEMLAGLRLASLAIAAVMIVSLSLIVPQRKCAMSGLGSRTLQVYVFHPFVYYPMVGCGIFQQMVPFMPQAGYAMIAAGIILSVVIAWPKWPDRMFCALKGLIRIDNDTGS